MRSQSNIEIRQIECEEYTLCADIYSTAWNVSLPKIQRTIHVIDFENEIRGELTLVAILDETIVGYISICEPEWFIHHLFIAPSAHGSGIGTALVSHLEGLAAPFEISLKCLLENTTAMRFYKTLGFTETPEIGVSEHGNWVRLSKCLR